MGNSSIFFGVFGVAMLSSCSCGTEPTVATEPVATVPESSENDRPNVLIVLWDTVRADRLSLYGYNKQTTPRLAEFAKEATVYERAWSPGMWTLPSHGSIFTGLPPTTHGALAGHLKLDEHHVTLAELLTDDGYDSFAFSSNVIASPMTDVLQGFETVYTTYPRGRGSKGRYVAASKQAAKRKIIADDASTEISPKFVGGSQDKWGKSVFKDAAPVLHKGLTDWLDERGGDAPWFAYLNMLEAHSPRIPSLGSRQKVMTEEEIALSLRTDASLFAENSYIVGGKTYTDAELAAISGVYDAALIDLDDATGDLLDDLGKRGLLENTVVVLLADHGESLGEHQRLEHRWAIHEPLLHVPFVIRYPKFFPAQRIDAPVSTIDLFATILDLAEVDVPDIAGIRSTSLVGRLPQGAVHAQLLDPWAAQLRSVRKAYPDIDYSPWLRTYETVVDGQEKFVLASDGAHALYDLSTDPGELHNLLEARADRAKVLEEQVTAWQKSLVPYDSTGMGGEQEISDEERAQLEALGYMEPEEEAP